MAVKAPLRFLVGCLLRPAASAAGLRPSACAPCAVACQQQHPHLVVWPSSRRVGAACLCATALKSVRRSTGGRAATRRHAHSCVIRERGGRACIIAERLEARQWMIGWGSQCLGWLVRWVLHPMHGWGSQCLGWLMRWVLQPMHGWGCQYLGCWLVRWVLQPMHGWGSPVPRLAGEVGATAHA